MDNLYYIVNTVPSGYDSETYGFAIISDEEFPHFKQIIEDLNKYSQFFKHMPTISIYKIDESFIRPANDTDNTYAIIYLGGKEYTLEKSIWEWDGMVNRLAKGVEEVL